MSTDPFSKRQDYPESNMKKLHRSGVFIALISVACLLLAIVSGRYVLQLNEVIQAKFEGKRWSLPATVYARPLELYPGLQLSPEMLEDELQLAGYRHEDSEFSPGSYRYDGSNVRLATRGFYFSTGFEPPQDLTLTFAGGRISEISATGSGDAVAVARLDPARIGSFHPLVHEDRILLSREEIPELLVQTLLILEDKNFYSHHGIAPLGIARALLANIRAGKTVQGGSTLTQQLVKNLFLTQERTLSRKIQEAVMALLLEFHYTKDEILTTYVNEVFLGQDNGRAIHGFALASQFYFRRSQLDLRPDQIAVLVGMVKGPSYYDPRRNPENSLQRRNLVLGEMADHGLISREVMIASRQQPLTELSVGKGGFNRFPAFLELVRHQLAGEYRPEDLKTNGLKIITTLNPHIQYRVERSLQTTLSALADRPEQKDLEGAVIITSRETGEVLALAGGKDPLDHGFNRALNANRPIGSLIKPAVFLSALEEGFSLAAPVQDTAISLDRAGEPPWTPENYDRQEHGRVAMFSALAHSYNLASVHLGLDVGLDKVISTIRSLGHDDELQPYPSLLLGAVDMTPYTVTQMYQTLASGGFFTSLRAIDTVMAADHSLLNRYGLAVEQRFSATSSYLLSHALQRVISEGTATALLDSSLKDHGVAGKTGTSDGLRDSWFAGFTGDHLAVVWLGRDDNAPCYLTGSTGALKVWTDIMEGIVSAPLQLAEPEGIVWFNIDRKTLGKTRSDGETSTLLPFVAGTEPSATLDIFTEGDARLQKNVKGVFERIKGWFDESN
jgi:penicillin-binding protein 1B